MRKLTTQKHFWGNDYLILDWLLLDLMVSNRVIDLGLFSTELVEYTIKHRLNILYNSTIKLGQYE